jgi:hypothetical protein
MVPWIGAKRSLKHQHKSSTLTKGFKPLRTVRGDSGRSNCEVS